MAESNVDGGFWKPLNEVSSTVRSNMMGKRKQSRPIVSSSEAQASTDVGPLSARDSEPPSTASSDTLSFRRISSTTSVSSNDSSHQSNSAASTGTTSASSLTPRSASPTGPKYQMSLAERIWADERQSKTMAIVRRLELVEEQRLYNVDEASTSEPNSPQRQELSVEDVPSSNENETPLPIEASQYPRLDENTLRLEVDLGEPLSAQDWLQTGWKGRVDRDSPQITPTVSVVSLDRTIETQEGDDASRRSAPSEIDIPTEELPLPAIKASLSEKTARIGRKRPSDRIDDNSRNSLTQYTIPELPDQTIRNHARIRSKSTPPPGLSTEGVPHSLDPIVRLENNTHQRSTTWPERRSSVPRLPPSLMIPNISLQVKSPATQAHEKSDVNRRSRLSVSHSSLSLKSDAAIDQSSSPPRLFPSPRLIPVPPSPVPSPRLLNEETEIPPLSGPSQSESTMSPPLPPRPSSPPPPPKDGTYELSSSLSVIRRPAPDPPSQVQRKVRSHTNLSAYNTLPHEPFPILPNEDEESDITEDTWKSAFRDIYTRHDSTPERIRQTEPDEDKAKEDAMDSSFTEPDVDPRTGRKWVQNRAMTWTKKVPEVEHLTGIAKMKR